MEVTKNWSLEQVPPIAFSEAVLDLADVLVEQDAR